MMEPEKTYQVEVSESADLSGLNVQIFEGLGRGINLLINELTLNLISGKSGPPKVLVEVVSGRLQDDLWDVDMATVLNDFLVDELSDFGSRVLFWTVEFECLSSGVVII